MDSRSYVFPFGIDSIPGIPPDFILPPGLGELTAGVFLPQGGTGCLGCRQYPARVALLTPREVVVAAHRTAGASPARVPVDAIECMEHGRVLLAGWITLWWDGGCAELPYNTAASGPVDAFVARLLERWLPNPSGPAAFEAACGAPLNLKFAHARSAELLAGETVLSQFFQPGRWEYRRAGPLSRKTRHGGDLLAATTRRLVWITERRRGSYEPYGTCSRSAPLEALRELRTKGNDSRGELEVVFRRGHSWRVPVTRGAGQQARAFEALLRRML